MKLAEATIRLQSYLNPKSIEFKLPALAARAWVGAENGSLSDGPSDTERKDMSQIQGKQDPAILSRDNPRIVTFSRRRSWQPGWASTRSPICSSRLRREPARFREHAPPSYQGPRTGSAKGAGTAGRVKRSSQFKERLKSSPAG